MTNPSPPDGPASTDGPARRFTDEEFAVILKRASELQVRGGDGPRGSGGTARGLSLEEVRQIAAEAGIDSRYVDEAVHALTAVPFEEANAFVGAPYAWEYHRTVAGRIPPEDVVRVLDALRSVMKQKGEIEDVYGTLEWHYDDSLGPVMVRLSGRGEETRIEVSARRGGEAGLWYGVAVPMGGLMGGAALARALGMAGPEVFAAVLGVGGMSWVATRALWRHLSARWERRLRTLTERVAGAAASVARPPASGDAVAAGAGAGPEPPADEDTDPDR